MNALRRAVTLAALAAGLAAAANGHAESLKVSGDARVRVELEADHLLLQALEPCARLSATVKGPGGYWKRQVFEGADPSTFELGPEAAPGAYVAELWLVAAGEPARSLPRVVRARFELGTASARATADTPVPETDFTISDATPQLIFNDLDDPSVDWQLRSLSNGASFDLQNTTSGASPLVVESGAFTNSLHVSGGATSPEIGIGTATPSVELHIAASNPAIALDSPTSGRRHTLAHVDQGFMITESGLDEAALFLANNAPGRSLQIDGNGNLAAFADGVAGFGGAGASLHVKRDNGTAKLLVEEASPSVAGRNMLQIKNNGASTFRFDNTATGQAWGFGGLGSGNFFVGSTPGQPLALTLTSAGNLSITGTLAQGSDRDSKADIEAADPRAVLAKLAELPLSTWRYKGDEALHVGPMAQDFAALFGLGADDKHIAPGDMAGLALAAIQALREDALVKDAHIRELEGRLGQLEAGRPRD